MSSLETRLQAFPQLPVGAQLALIPSTFVNPVLGKNQEDIENLEPIYAECLLSARSEQKAAYEQTKAFLYSSIE